VPLAVEDFVLTDRSEVSRLAAPPPADTREALFLVEDGDGWAVGLFMDAEVVSHLDSDDPRDTLHEGNLADFCIALEGVSHFIYMAWRAHHGRPVTQLELEMQAEVDKFAASAMFLGRQLGGEVPEGLSRRLFANASFLPGLAPESRERYERASEYAGRFCEELEKRYVRVGEGAGMTRELRRFYRLDQRQKIQHIETARGGT
jgi:hypothetical protein